MTAHRFLLPIFAAVLALPGFAHSPYLLTPEEQAMVPSIDKNEQAPNLLVEQLVNINSGTHNLDGVLVAHL